MACFSKSVVGIKIRTVTCVFSWTFSDLKFWFVSRFECKLASICYICISNVEIVALFFRRSKINKKLEVVVSKSSLWVRGSNSMERAASGHGSGHGVGNGRGRGSSGGRSSFQGSNRDDRGGRRASYLSRGGKIGIGRGRGGASESNNLNSIGRSSSAGHRRGHRGGRGGRGNWVRSRGARGSSNSSSSSVGQGRNNRGDYNDDGSAGYGSNKAMRGRGGGNRGRGSKRTGLRSDLKKPSKLSEVKQKGLNARHARDSIDISKGVINSNQPKVRPLRPQKSKADSQTNEAAVKYKLTHRILIVGDGDFSFSHGLVRHLGGDGSNIVATSHDSRKKVIDKYNMSDTHLSDLTASGCRIVHGIDAGDLHNHFPKQANYFHRVIFNFPHTGLQRVHLNKDLIRRFLISAPYVLHPNGQIHITIKMRYFLRTMAKSRIFVSFFFFF